MPYFTERKGTVGSPIHGGVSKTELRALGIDRDAVIDFSVNISPLGPSLEVMHALRHLDISAYPDPESLELREALCRLTGVPLEQIVIGNGSTELIHLVTQTYLTNGDIVGILTPTFSEYEVAAKRVRSEAIFFEAKDTEGFIWNVSKTCQEIRKKKPKLVFVCNPNNPTGVYLNRKEVEELSRATGEGLLVLDEAYISFVQNAWKGHELLNLGNIIVLRSMTKDYALAGLRLGYALCPRHNAKALADGQPSWSVNAVAQIAGVAALSDTRYLDRARSCVEASKGYLRQEIQKLGFEISPSAANFLMIKVGNATLFRHRLLSEGICVRDCSSFGLPDYIRIGVRAMPECERLMNALREVRASDAEVLEMA